MVQGSRMVSKAGSELVVPVIKSKEALRGLMSFGARSVTLSRLYRRNFNSCLKKMSLPYVKAEVAEMQHLTHSCQVRQMFCFQVCEYTFILSMYTKYVNPLSGTRTFTFSHWKEGAAL